MCKTFGRIRMWIGNVFISIRIRIGITMEKRLRIRIGMPIHNTGTYGTVKGGNFVSFFVQIHFLSKMKDGSIHNNAMW
jgi:hypothetical protein